MIAGGIGVTPFASILQSIMKKVQNATIDCPNCQHKWVGMLPEELRKLKKVQRVNAIISSYYFNLFKHFGKKLSWRSDQYVNFVRKYERSCPPQNI